ncbi:uncharacterized protein LOC122511429 [Leptopilina heterotoma]|uniref:uncharacterized protein LOC122511429 n=1 Tax=Leptopilina heterotoma TaxID=63436 RepID=UPI001CA86778|nr:uncharacterized protein LOC122511429 [Leptopilina heterotoma]
MAKEMMIVFVYNTVKCTSEEDDPAESVMYFHPSWVSPSQKLLLAGQLMGVNQFLTTSFSSPCLISLRGGKFVLKKLGQYVLAVGTDRNIQDWILQRRASTLESILKFFHCDIETISTSLNNDKNKFTEKLYQMFETYLPILQYNSSLFFSNPSLKLPRSASHVFLEAIQILQNCQEIIGIIGGALFYNNKVVASQLSAEITKQLVITDPYRIKTPAEKISTMYHLPVGVQLLYVYIEQSQIGKMIHSANLERSYSSHLAASIKKVLHNKKNFKNNCKDQPLLMKRDISRIFTVPEEGELDSISDNSFSNFTAHPSETCNSPINQKEECKNESIKQQFPVTPSVCCTPLKDVQRILHGTAVSICSTTDEAEMSKEAINKSDERKKDPNDIPDIVKEALLCKKLNKLKNATSSDRFIKFEDSNKKSLSLIDIKHHSSQDLWESSPELNKNLPLDYKSCTTRRKTLPNKRYFNTITDPNFPVFRADGVQVTHSLYNQYITSHYQELNQDTEISLASKTSKKKNNSTEMGKLKKDMKQKSKVSSNVKLQNISKQELYRSSLSLPLKPLNVLDTEERSKTSNSNSVFEKQRKHEGLQLTPLMSKLSLIIDENRSGVYSRDNTPSEFNDFSGYSALSNNLIKNKLDSSVINNESNEEIEMDLIKNKSSVQKTELFLCGHQNMVLMLLLENGMCSDPELIHSLWRTCINNLGKLEICLQQCLDPLPITENKELYSVLSVNSEWDTTYRSGLWGVTELDILATLHNRFTNKNNLTEIIIRSDDAVVYGNQCGNVEVFYQQTSSSSTYGGLPTPADLMGIVPLKAKRRIERDHDIILM